MLGGLRSGGAGRHDARVSEPTSLARRAWAHYEPVHAVVYFAPEAREHFEGAGLKGGWMGYFASRSAPMGAVGPEVVTAVFHNFAPGMVRRAIPDAWTLSTPERVTAARLAAVDAMLRRLWGDEVVGSPEVAEAAELALAVAAALQADGRPLYAGHAGQPVPDAPHLALWHACTLLREHRFDGHIAALTGYGVDGLGALVLQVGSGKYVDAAFVRRFRGWSDEEWAAKETELRERGLIDDQAQLTADGRALRDAFERITDRLAAVPWDSFDATRRERLLELLRPLVARLEAPGGLIYPNPIGVSRPELS